MKTILLLSIFIVFANIANTQSAYINNYSTHFSKYQWDGYYLKDYKSGKDLCQFYGTTLIDYQVDSTQFVIAGDYINDYKTGFPIFKRDGKYFNDYKSGVTLLVIDEYYISEYKSGRTIYQIQGEVPEILITYITAIEGKKILNQNKSKNTQNTEKNNTNPILLGKVTGTFEVGSFVGAKVEGGSDYHYSIITKVDGELFEVKTYYYRDDYTVKKNDLILIPPKVNFTEGDKVFAVWSNGRFYDGTLGKVEKNGAYVKWNDGSKPIFVEFDQMIKK